MADTFLIGVDIGTTGSKGVLVDVSGRVLAYQQREHSVSTPRPGWCEQDADAVWWGDLSAILRSLLAQSGVDPGAIAAVGVSALSPNLLPVDAEGRPLRPALIYSDMRAANEIEELMVALGMERVVQAAGRALPPDSVGAKLLWLRKNEPQVFSRMRTVHTATSYLVFRLTGQTVMDPLNADGNSPLYDWYRSAWREDLCHELHVRPEMLPVVRETIEVAGGVTATAAVQTGLAEGTPVIVGAVDGPAEMLSTGAVGLGEGSLLYGTTMILGITIPRPPPTYGLWTFPACLPTHHRAVVVMLASAALTRWFRDTLGQPEREAEATTGVDAYQLLSAEAESIPPGSQGLVALPYFAGERTPIWDAQARGAILGLTLSHTRRHIYRSLLEATACGLRHGLEQYQSAGGRVARLVATGGGTRSRLWTQIISDVTGYDQEVLLAPYGAPYGDAYLAGMGVGLFPDLSHLRDRWAQAKVPVRANPQVKAVYDRQYQVYKGLYAKLKDDMHALAGLSGL